MDFKGHFAMLDGARCHPLTVLDDHSRYALELRACRDERGDTVRAAEAFDRLAVARQVVEVAALHRRGNLRQTLERPSCTHFLACRAEAEAALPVQPVRAGEEAVVPAAPLVELAEHDQQLVGGGVDARVRKRDVARDEGLRIPRAEPEAWPCHDLVHCR